ncbi:MAG TPA: HAD family hydrolase [Burkholderiales bacterium]|nr:HAD family hydrolase [Burkholderiales bacterium]
MQQVYLKARAVRLAIFDVDGVLTDGGLHYSDSGEETKIFDVRDGHGMKMLQSSGVEIAIITSRSSKCVARRAENLGIDLLFQGVENKVTAFQALVGDLELEPVACAYMGDDWVDLPVLLRCGLALSVPEAPAVVRQRVHYVTHARGGRGAVREACELIMQAQGTFQSHLAAFLV